MDPVLSLQDVMRCHYCETPIPPKHCDICHIHICDACEEKHLSDESKEHYIVPFKMRGLTPNCLKHSTKICKLHCEYCDVPICAECESSAEHEQHKKETLLKSYTRKKELIQSDLQELEDIIYPKYQDAASDIPIQKADLSNHAQKLKISLNDKAQTLHTEIDTIIQKMQADIDVINIEHMATIEKQETVIKQIIEDLSWVILKVRRLLETNDIYLVSKYKSRNHKFKTIPTRLQVTLPRFIHTNHNREQIAQQIGFISKLAVKRLPISTNFLDEPRVIADINIKENNSLLKPLRSVSCLSDSEFWACQNNNIIRLYNLQGDVIKYIQTSSENMPQSITVTRSGDLVYTDYWDSSINLVSGTQVQTLITLPGWSPLYISSTSSGDLLAFIRSDDRSQTKVVRYSGSTEKQSIQWDDRGKPLYTSGEISIYKHLSENRNLDICVADCEAGAVVVVSAAGKLRFLYTGPLSIYQESFSPLGITTDSKANILTSDLDSKSIHIVDRDGNFLRYLKNCGLRDPIDLSIDNFDNLFIAEKNYIVRKIQYYK
ncbi:uncharacterized protein LOC111115339 [Crassostrea virginica]